MKSPALYTVVVPVFERAETVEAAVRSALDQDALCSEVVVVDDGSRDGTIGVLRGICDERLSVLARPHEGRCASRNAGAREGLGQWLVFLDSDDVLLPGALQAFESVRTQAARLMVAPTRQVSTDGAVSVRDVFWDSGAQLPWGLQAGGFAICRALFTEIGGYCTELDHSEHTEMALRLRRVAPVPEVVRLDRPTVEVRQRPDRYDPEVQYRSAVHLLAHVGAELAADPEARANQMAVAGEAARRLGKRWESLRYLAGSFVARPRWRTAARLLRSLSPMPVTRR